MAVRDLFRRRVERGPRWSDAEPVDRAELAARRRFESLTDAELLALPDAEFDALGAAMGVCPAASGTGITRGNEGRTDGYADVRGVA